MDPRKEMVRGEKERVREKESELNLEREKKR